MIHKLIVCLLFGVVSARDTRELIEAVMESPRVTNWGRWGRPERCTPGLLVTGFQLKVHTKRPNQDNTAMNGVRFSCGAPYYPEYQDMELITSAYERNGRARERKFCEGYATGFQLKSQGDQERGDDAAAVNMKLICDDGTEIEGYDEQEEYDNATYTEKQMCPDNTAICGLQTQVERLRRRNDNTALNNVRVRCCKIPDEYTTTTSSTTEAAGTTEDSGTTEGSDSTTAGEPAEETTSTTEAPPPPPEPVGDEDTTTAAAPPTEEATEATQAPEEETTTQAPPPEEPLPTFDFDGDRDS